MLTEGGARGGRRRGKQGCGEWRGDGVGAAQDGAARGEGWLGQPAGVVDGFAAVGGEQEKRLKWGWAVLKFS